MRNFLAITILVILIFVILNSQGSYDPQEGNDEIEKKNQHTHADREIDSDSADILMQSNESDIREHRHTIDTEVILPIENTDMMENENENSRLNQNRSKESVELDKDHNEKDINIANNIDNNTRGAEAETAMHRHHPISDALLERIPDHIHDINNSAEKFDYEYIEYVPNHTNTEL